MRASCGRPSSSSTTTRPSIYTWDYARQRQQLVSLYDKANASQWNSVTELDWDTDVDAEELARSQDTPVLQLVRAAAEVPGSPLASWSQREFDQLALELLRASLSQFMHGEQGAMLVAAKIVETVPWIDAKYYAATQTMDEARHTEVFARYLHSKLGEPYRMGPDLEAQITALLEDGRWDIAYLGMQIVIESLALAAFGDLLRRTDEPLLHKLLRYVMADEARHVAFGVLTLGELYQGLSSAELKERQEFLLNATQRSRNRSLNAEVWERMGTTFDAVWPSIQEARGAPASARPARSSVGSSPSSSPTSASSACSTPTTATCAAGGPTSACCSSSSPTTRRRTTSPTTPSPTTAPERDER